MSLHVNHIIEFAYEQAITAVVPRSLRRILEDFFVLEERYNVRGIEVLAEMSASLRDAEDGQDLRRQRSENYIRANKQSAVNMHVGGLVLKMDAKTVSTLREVMDAGATFLATIGSAISLLQKFVSPISLIHPAFCTYPTITIGLFFCRALHVCLACPDPDIDDEHVMYGDTSTIFLKAVDRLKIRPSRLGVQWQWDSMVSDVMQLGEAFEMIIPFRTVIRPEYLACLQNTWDEEIGDYGLEIPGEDYAAVYEDFRKTPWVAASKRLISRSEWSLGMRDLARSFYVSQRFLANVRDGSDQDEVDEFIAYRDEDSGELVRCTDLQSALCNFYRMLLPFVQQKAQRVRESMGDALTATDYDEILVNETAELMCAIVLAGAIVTDEGKVFKDLHVSFWTSRGINARASAPFVSSCEKCRELFLSEN